MLLSNKLNDRCEKSKLEVIGLNKGISRKNEENSQLRTDVSDLESRIEEFQTNWASQEAELGQFDFSTRSPLEDLKQEGLSSLGIPGKLV